MKGVGRCEGQADGWEPLNFLGSRVIGGICLSFVERVGGRMARSGAFTKREGKINIQTSHQHHFSFLFSFQKWLQNTFQKIIEIKVR